MTGAILVAAGSGERFGGEGGKQMAPLAGEPLFVHALRCLERAVSVEEIVLVCQPGRTGEFRDAATLSGSVKVSGVVDGGATRGDSVRAGLAVLPLAHEVVVIHDGARPLSRPEDVDRAVKALLDAPQASGVLVGHEAIDTIKMVDGTRVVETPDRERLWQVFTPQVFRASALRSAHESAVAESFEGTDDASLVERHGGEVHVVRGPRIDLKVTVPSDIALAEALLSQGGGA